MNLFVFFLYPSCPEFSELLKSLGKLIFLPCVSPALTHVSHCFKQRVMQCVFRLNIGQTWGPIPIVLVLNWPTWEDKLYWYQMPSLLLNIYYLTA